MALYRKYRPQSFDDLQGQSSIRNTLLEALKQNKLVHAYLFRVHVEPGKPLRLGLSPRPFNVSSAFPAVKLVEAVTSAR